MTSQNQPKMGELLRKITQYLVVLNLLVNGFGAASVNNNVTVPASPTNSSTTWLHVANVTQAAKSTSSPVFESRQKLSVTTRGE